MKPANDGSVAKNPNPATVEFSSDQIDSCDAVISRTGRYGEFITNVGTTDIIRHAGPGLTVDHVIAEHQHDFQGCHESSIEEAADGRGRYDPVRLNANSYDYAIWSGPKLLAALHAAPDGSPCYCITRFDQPTPPCTPPIAPAAPEAMKTSPKVRRPIPADPAGLPDLARETCRRLIREWEESRRQYVDFKRDHPGVDDPACKWSVVLCNRISDAWWLLLSAIVALDPEVTAGQVERASSDYHPVRGAAYNGRLYVAYQDRDIEDDDRALVGKSTKGNNHLVMLGLDAIVDLDAVAGE